MDAVPTIIFAVQGSAAQPYEVRFEKRGERVLASCSCPAGTFQSLCKHRLNIFAGLSDGIVSNNIADVLQVQQWVKGTEIETALAEMSSIEAQIEKLKKQLNNVKKTLAKVMA